MNMPAAAIPSASDLHIDDEGTVRLFGLQFSAQSIDQLVQTLAKVRPFMQPEVPRDPLRIDGSFGCAVHVQGEPDLLAGPIEGSLRVAFRHMGLGWVGFDLDRARAAGLRDQITAALDGPQALAPRRQGDRTH